MEYHPLVSKYFAKLGHLDLLLERLGDLFDEKQDVKEIRESRLRFGLRLDPVDQVWPENSQKKLPDLYEEINCLEKELKELKRRGIAFGLFDESGELANFHTQEQWTFKREDIDPQNETSEYTKYPLLLPRLDLEIGNSGSYVSRLENSDTTNSRINQWMLEKLRISALDVQLLANTFEGLVGETDDRWQVNVLSFWYEDGTIESTTANPALSLDLSA
jgi:hypothetical protein